MLRFVSGEKRRGDGSLIESQSLQVTETQVAQIELDKTTEEFKRLHRERHDLIAQWEAAIDNMKKRDQDILDAQGRYQGTKVRITRINARLLV